MGLPSVMTYWAFLPEVWAILAIILICADILLAFDFFVLPIGVSALILAGLLFAQRNLWFGDLALLETWRDIAVWLAGLSLVSTILIRLAFRRRHSRADINDY